jgi:hypothetical protein
MLRPFYLYNLFMLNESEAPVFKYIFKSSNIVTLSLVEG